MSLDRTAFEGVWCRRRHRLAALALALAVPTLQAASFPCAKATTTVEKAICASSELSALDEDLARYYAAGREGLRHAEGCLVSDQRAWIRSVRDGCKDAACLRDAYLGRLAALHAIQPGATSLRNIELPRMPSLVWIVPPAADQVAAPRNVQTSPLTVAAGSSTRWRPETATCSSPTAGPGTSSSP